MSGKRPRFSDDKIDVKCPSCGRFLKNAIRGNGVPARAVLVKSYCPKCALGGWAGDLDEFYDRDGKLVTDHLPCDRKAV